MLVSFAGITNTIGRVTAGALANVSGVNILHLNNISLVITGIATVACGAFCRNLTHLAIYAAVFGFFVGGYHFTAKLYQDILRPFQRCCSYTCTYFSLYSRLLLEEVVSILAKTERQLKMTTRKILCCTRTATVV